MFKRFLIFCLMVSAVGLGVPVISDAADSPSLHPCIRAKNIIKARLKDPGSAEMRCKGSMIPYDEADGQGQIMAVEVNAKNSFGAYAGEEMYGVIFMNDGRVKVGRF